jgi:hypothetical protein
MESSKDITASKESIISPVVAESSLEVSHEPARKRPRGSRELRGLEN